VSAIKASPVVARGRKESRTVWENIMPYAISRARVADRALWERVWEESAPHRASGEIRSIQVFRNPDDPTEIVLLWEVDDLEALRERFQSEPALQAARECGATERVMYFPEA
jgi:hypothetical protein